MPIDRYHRESLAERQLPMVWRRFNAPCNTFRMIGIFVGAASFRTNIYWQLLIASKSKFKSAAVFHRKYFKLQNSVPFFRLQEKSTWYQSDRWYEWFGNGRTSIQCHPIDNARVLQSTVGIQWYWSHKNQWYNRIRRKSTTHQIFRENCRSRCS